MTIGIWSVVSGGAAMSLVYVLSVHWLSRRSYWHGFADGMRRGRESAGDGKVTVERGDDGVMNVTVEVDMRSVQERS